MHFLELFDLALADLSVFYQQALEHSRPGTEHSRLLHQRAMPIEGLAERRAQRHRVALATGPLAQLVPGGEHVVPLHLGARLELGQGHRKTRLHLPEIVQVLGFPHTDAEGAEELSKAIGTATFEGRTESHSVTIAENRIVTANTQ